VAEDVAQDVAESVLGAANDGSVKVSIVARVIFHACPWVTREGQHMEDAAQDVAEDVLGS